MVFFINIFLIAASPIGTFSKNTFGSGVNGARERISISSESFLGFTTSTLVLALTGEN